MPLYRFHFPYLLIEITLCEKGWSCFPLIFFLILNIVTPRLSVTQGYIEQPTFLFMVELKEMDS